MKYSKTELHKAKGKFYQRFIYFPIPKQYLDKIWSWFLDNYGIIEANEK